MSLTRRTLHHLALPVWTLVVWVPRIRNIWSDDELAVDGQLVRTAWSVIFIVFAVGALVVARRRPEWYRLWMRAFVAWTVGFWAIRGTQIALGDHDAAFIAVHTVLALVSIALAWWSWPGDQADRRSSVSAGADHG
ncbi:MAG: hypothetical protein ACR2QE_06920 [Acidimicrobiales bacterium]